tara:strand:- start:1754 stop:1882 length:129 start_codon:yes stop_codon:yes gene_type:complete
MEHLTNCHGEWTAILAGIGYLSFGALWLKLRFQSLGGQKNED